MIFNNLTTEREREREFFIFQNVAKMASIIKHDAHKLEIFINCIDII